MKKLIAFFIFLLIPSVAFGASNWQKWQSVSVGFEPLGAGTSNITSQLNGANFAVAFEFIPDTDKTVKECSMFNSASGNGGTKGTYKASIYSDNATTGLPNVELASTTSFSTALATSTWYRTESFSYAVTGGTPHWCAFTNIL